MNMEPSVIALLEQADDIASQVKEIIAEPRDPDKDSKQIRNLYSPWRAAAARHLNDDQKKRFNEEYSGSIWSPKIRKCIEGVDKRPHVNTAQKNLEPLSGTWHEQLEARFIHPFNEQCEILRENAHTIGTTPDRVLDNLEAMCRRLPEIFREFKKGTPRRKAWSMETEYDVQDVLSIILKAQYDDVRAEESAPSFAGKGFRVDFWLKNEQICLEVKMTREGLKTKKLRTELFEDIAQYKKFPNADGLFIYVYDPNRHIANSSAFESDMNEADAQFPIRTVVGHLKMCRIS